MVNTNPLYTTAEMTHQFSDSGAVGLVAIDVFANKVADVLPKTSIRTVVLVSVADLLPPLKRFVVRSVQRYVKKMVPPATFAHVTFPGALEQGAARIANGADPQSYRAALSHESLAALQYTGGTTGVAKGAMLTHRNLLRKHHQQPRNVEAVSGARCGGAADGAAAVPHLRVHREPDALLHGRRPQHPDPEPAAIHRTSSS